jgi:hypothetical protein
MGQAGSCKLDLLREGEIGMAGHGHDLSGVTRSGAGPTGLAGSSPV